MKLVSTMVMPLFEAWLNQNVEQGKAIAELAIKQAQSRLKDAQKVEKKPNLPLLNPDGTLPPLPP